jgi:cytosine deaminase
MNDQEGLAVALEEAIISYNEGGVPIGAALVSRDGKLLGRFVNLFQAICLVVAELWKCMSSLPSLLKQHRIAKSKTESEYHRGHNMRVQKGSPIHHGEISALENSGRLPASAYKGATMFTTQSPCDMW